MRTNTINAQDIWNASNLEESKMLLAALNKEIKKIKVWHGWAQSAEDLKAQIARAQQSAADLKAQIANGEEGLRDLLIEEFGCRSIRGLRDLLIEAETNRDNWEADNKDGMIR